MLNRWLTALIEQKLAEMPAVALLGARQVGKTTLAKAIGGKLNAIYVDLEAPDDVLKLQDPLSFFKQHSGRLVILDEVQRVPDLFMILRGVIDRHKEQGHKSGQFLLLGSASMNLLKQSSESLAGRITFLNMGGFNVLEIEHEARMLQQLWLRGGFPDSYLASQNTVAMDWLDDLIRSYLERDIPQLGFRVPASRLRRLWTMLAHLQGEPINQSKLGANLEVDGKTIRHYLDILTDLLLVRRISPWYANVKKRLIKSPRYYIRDSGIQHCLLGINSYDELLSNPVLGKSWEGFVVENILSILPRRAESYYYRTAAGAEIDLVLKLSASEVWAIEIKYGVAPKLDKHFTNTCHDVNATKKYVVYGGDDEFNINEQVTVISLRKLMAKLQAM